MFKLKQTGTFQSLLVRLEWIHLQAQFLELANYGKENYLMGITYLRVN